MQGLDALIKARNTQKYATLVHENPKLVFARCSLLLTTISRTEESNIHPKAIIHNSVVLGKGVKIGPNVVIEKGSIIGSKTEIKAGSFIGNGVEIGSDCVIHPNVTINKDVVVGDSSIINPVQLSVEGVLVFVKTVQKRGIKFPNVAE